MERLPNKFFQRDVLQVAPEIAGENIGTPLFR